MKKLLFTTLSALLFLGTVGNKSVATTDSKKINIYIDRDMVCVHRTNKCYSFAQGKASYPTPRWEGAQYLTTHIKNGFKWQNPITGVVYNKGTHNLGDIWIQFYKDEDPLSPTYGWAFGFHKTPEQHIPLHLQESHGCLRMIEDDLLDFSNSVFYFDEFYIIEN